MDYKLLITTSGTGSRLGDLTKDTNKALIEVGGKKIISHIIDLYHENIEIIITLGYYGNKVKDFLQKTYPNRKISYIYVDKYEGIGSSLGYSILQAKEKLNTPFIFHCNDTIVNKYTPIVKSNWVGGYRISDSTQYTTFKTKGTKIISYNIYKGALDFDYTHIGLIGIYEYEKFFDILKNLHKKASNNSSLNDVFVLDQMIKTGSEIKYIEFSTWLDTGNLDSLKKSEGNIIFKDLLV